MADKGPAEKMRLKTRMSAVLWHVPPDLSLGS